MDEKVNRSRRIRFGLAGLFALVAVAAIVAVLWNPFPKRITVEDFLKVKKGTRIENVREQFGDPLTSFGMSTIDVYDFRIDGSYVMMVFRDGKLEATEVTDVRLFEDIPLDRFPAMPEPTDSHGRSRIGVRQIHLK